MNPSTAIDVLRAAGLTEQAIGAAVGARQSTINRIRRNQMQPTYEVGKALVDMAQAAELMARRAARRKAAKPTPAPEGEAA